MSKRLPNSNSTTRRIGNMVRVLQREIRSWVCPYLFPAVAAFLTPVGYLLYVLFVRWFQGDPLIITSLLSLEMLLYFLVMALTGTITSLNWGWGLRASSYIAVVGLLVWPWTYTSFPIGSAGYVSVLLVGVLLVTVAEAMIRYPERRDQFLTSSIGQYALTVGVLHFLLGFGIQIYARRFYWVEYSFPGNLIMGVVYVVSGLALVTIGAVSVILWKRRGLILPAILTAGWALWGLYGTWMMRNSLPWGHFQGVLWISLRPYPDYMLQWMVLLVAFLVLAGSELTARKTFQHIFSSGNMDPGSPK